MPMNLPKKSEISKTAEFKEATCKARLKRRKVYLNDPNGDYKRSDE